LVINALDLGSLYHKILEDFYKRGSSANLAAVIDEHFRSFEQEGVTGYPSVWAIKQEIIRHELAAFVAREKLRLGADWRPDDFEKEFKDQVVAPPVRLRGKIDRIDRSANGRHLRVLDYKTGRVPRGLKDDSLARGEALQLPLYLLAARQIWPAATVDEASYLYFTLRGGYRSIGFSRAALDEKRDELHRLLQVAADMIRNGVFAQYATVDGCRRCDFRPICGNGILKLAERKAEDERLAAFRDIKETVA
jgi:ATP-dependent helicase/DNAse subunit B